MFEQIAHKLKRMKQLRLTIQSVWLFRFIVFIGLAPFTLALFYGYLPWQQGSTRNGF